MTVAWNTVNKVSKQMDDDLARCNRENLWTAHVFAVSN